MNESPSMKQKQYAAAVCPEFMPSGVILSTNHETEKDRIICDDCMHWDNDKCVIFDNVITSIDQT